MAAVSEGSIDELMRTIAEMAPRKRHRLSADMVNGTRTLTEAAALMVIRNLEKCQDVPVSAPPAPAESARAPRENPFPPPLAAFKGVIPAGFYATPRADGDVVDFWKVNISARKGQYEGWSFARRVLGGGTGEKIRAVDLTNMQQRMALAAIRDYGAEKAGMLFAERMTRCMDCGLDLTDEVSRATGRGRICREKRSN